MSSKSSPKHKKAPKLPATQGVTVLRLGIGKEEHEFPEGSTLADLLRKVGEESDGHDVLIDGRPITERVVLQQGMIVSLTPKANGANRTPPWLQTIGMFRDDHGFQEFSDRVQADRDADRVES